MRPDRIELRSRPPTSRARPAESVVLVREFLPVHHCDPTLIEDRLELVLAGRGRAAWVDEGGLDSRVLTVVYPLEERFEVAPHLTRVSQSVRPDPLRSQAIPIRRLDLDDDGARPTIGLLYLEQRVSPTPAAQPGAVRLNPTL